MAKTERGLGYALLGMITRPQEGEDMHRGEDEDECDQVNYSGRGVVNKDGAWCWRENCKGIDLPRRLLDKVESYWAI
jgi:sorting nexin-9/18/33